MALPSFAQRRGRSTSGSGEVPSAFYLDRKLLAVSISSKEYQPIRLHFLSCGSSTAMIALLLYFRAMFFPLFLF